MHQQYRLYDSGAMKQFYLFGGENISEKIVGGWVNEDVDTRSLTKIGVSQSGRSLNAHAWGSCSRVDCDWGTTSVAMVGSSISDTTPYRSVAEWDHGFSEVFTMSRVTGGDLIVESFTVFKDDSGRYNYHTTENTFWKVGDANRDGHFNHADFVQVFVAGEYNDGIPGNSTWAEGDWNRDGDFNELDLVEAFICGGYDPPQIHIVPELLRDPIQPIDLPTDDRFVVVDEVFGFSDGRNAASRYLVLVREHHGRAGLTRWG